MAPVNFSVGDRAIHTNWMYGAERICTIQDIRGPVECGGVFKGEVETPATVRFANGRHANATLGTLKPYETPKYPPESSLPSSTWTVRLKRSEKLKTTSWRRGTTKEENNLKEEMDENDLLSILAGEGRVTALLGIDPEDMDDFEDKCNMREEYHPSSQSLHKEGELKIRRLLSIGVNGDEVKQLRDRNHSSVEGAEELDKDRIMVEATVKNKGDNYMSATTKYGALYIDLKYTKYVPEVGEKFKCIMGIKGPTGNLPWKCYRIV